MDIQRLKIRFETLYIRSRSLFKTALRLGGLAVILLGAYNLFLAPMLGQPPVAPYRLSLLVTTPWGGAYYVTDALLICLGAAIAWFV